MSMGIRGARKPHGDVPVATHAMELGRRDADDGEPSPVDAQGLARNRWIAGEQRSPQIVADDRDRNRSRELVLLRKEPPPHRQLHSQEREVPRLHERRGHSAGCRPLAGHVEADHRCSDHAGDRRHHGNQCSLIETREIPGTHAPFGLPLGKEHLDESVVIRHTGDRTQEQPIADAEDRRRRADSQREGHHGDRGEAGSLPESPEAVADILNERFRERRTRQSPQARRPPLQVGQPPQREDRGQGLAPIPRTGPCRPHGGRDLYGVLLLDVTQDELPPPAPGAQHEDQSGQPGRRYRRHATQASSAKSESLGTRPFAMSRSA